MVCWSHVQLLWNKGGSSVLNSQISRSISLCYYYMKQLQNWNEVYKNKQEGIWKKGFFTFKIWHHHFTLELFLHTDYNEKKDI